MDKDAKEKLLAAAVPLFAEKGFAAVSIREVAEAAGVNSALISYYFGGKSGLYEAVLNEQFSVITVFLQSLGAQPLTPPEKIRGYAKAVARAHQREPHLIYLWFREMAEPSSPFRHIIVEKIAMAAQFLRETLLEGVRLGLFRADVSPEYAVIGLAGMMNFFFAARPALSQMMPHMLLENEQYVETMAELFLHSLEKTERRDAQ